MLQTHTPTTRSSSFTNSSLATKLTRDIGSQYEYSKPRRRLAPGHVLARRAGMDYEKFVRSRICEPPWNAEHGHYVV